MIDLKPYHTFATSDKVSRIEIVESLADLEALKLSETQPFVVLGEGSNVLFTENYQGTVVINRIESIFVDELEKFAIISAGAGFNWHQFVCRMSESGYYGLENLACIPGTVGAAPVQNIGAYSVEVAEFIDQVMAYDLRSKTVVKIKARQCGFSYRTSFFKQNDWQKRYIIIAVSFCLPKAFIPNLTYKELKETFTTNLCTPELLLKEVISIRQNKLPNPHVTPNAGSFFKNPVINFSQFELLVDKHASMPFYALEDEMFKIPAAWLIEQAGFKGMVQENGVGVYDKHALILINKAGASGGEIYHFACDIMREVKKMFNIQLEPEVRVIGDDVC